MNNILAHTRGMLTAPKEELYCLGTAQKSYMWYCLLLQIILLIIILDNCIKTHEEIHLQ